MTALPCARTLTRIAVLVSALLLATAAHAYETVISSCNPQLVIGHATLGRDLDCSAADVVNGSIVIGRGTLDLNGHTLVTPPGYGILCSGNCKIVGPGTITGAGSAIGGSKSVKVIDVDIAVTGGIGVAAFDKLSLLRVTVNGPWYGTIGAATKIVDSTINATVVGALSGSGSMAEGPCRKGGLLLRRSTVTGTTSAYCDGAEPPTNCADLVSCKRPKLLASTCGTSCQAGAGVPCPSWGVCSAD